MGRRRAATPKWALVHPEHLEEARRALKGFTVLGAEKLVVHATPRPDLNTFAMKEGADECECGSELFYFLEGETHCAHCHTVVD